MELLKLVVEQVHLDEPLQWNVFDAIGNLLLKKGYVITRESQRDALVARGVFADEKEVRASQPKPEKAAIPISLFGLWEHSVWKLHGVLKLPEHAPDFAGQIEQVARHVIDLVDRDPDVAIYLTVRQDAQRYALYGWLHAIHTAILGLLMARRLGWAEDRTLTLMKAALTMNLASMELQGKMAAQEDPPSTRQRELISHHAADSAAQLRGRGVRDADWLQAVEQHHGVPAGSTTPQSEWAHALQLTDVFLAKISPRLHRPSLPIQVAAKQMFQTDKGGAMAMAIVREFGIYPPGEFVKLLSGELALVVRRSSSPNTPKVACLTDTKGHPVAATHLHDTSQPAHAIVAVQPAGTMVMRVPPERLYGAMIVS